MMMIVVIVVVVMLVLVVIVVMLVLIVVVMMLMVVIMVVTATCALIAVVVVMIMSLLSLIHHCLLKRLVVLHSLSDGCSIDLIPWSCNDGCMIVLLSDHGYSLLYLVLCSSLCSAQDDSVSTLDLVVEELAKVLHIILTFDTSATVV